MLTTRPSRLPDPWIPSTIADELTSILILSALGTGTIVATNNDAHFVPIVPPCDAILYSMSFAAANGTGNYDLGLYDASLSLLASSGSTAMSASGIKTLSLPNIRVRAGELYYAAAAFSSSSAQVFRPNYAVGQAKGSGWGFQASALPLPSTATPVTTTNYSVIPIFAFGIR